MVLGGSLHWIFQMSYKRKNSITSPIQPTIDKAVKTNAAVVTSIRKATAATKPNAVAATTVSGNSIVRKFSDNRFIAYNRVSL